MNCVDPMRRTLLLMPLLIALALNVIPAYSLQSADTLLSSYNVPQSTISSLAASNVTYNGMQYMALYSGSSPRFVINTLNDSFVMDANAIFGIIRPRALNATFATANFVRMTAQMHSYESSSSGPLADCLYETGLSSGSTCTTANYCESCQFIPNCKTTMDETYGPTGPLGTGIMKLETQYAWLNSSYSLFYSSMNGITALNAYQRLPSANAAFLNISNLTKKMYMNSLFPPTSDITPSVYGQCVYYTNSANAPWYCTALGYCQALTYNYTTVNTIQSELNSIGVSSFSNSTVMALAQSVLAIEGNYISPVVTGQKRAELGTVLNTTLAGYNSLVGNATALLGRVSNDSLQTSLSQLEQSYVTMVANYATINFTAYTPLIASEYANVSSGYAKLNATYASVLALASGNTANIIEVQMTTPQASGIASIALAELALNNELASGGITDLAGMSSQLKSVSTRLASYSTGSFSIFELARAIDAPFVRGAATTFNLHYAAAVAMGPVIGTLFGLVIFVVIFLVMLLVRSYMIVKHKVVLDKRRRSNWFKLFVAYWVFVVAYLLVNYAVLSYASAHTPFSAFSSALASSTHAVVVLNGTLVPNELSCATTMMSKLDAEGKNSIPITLGGGNCTIGNVTKSDSVCLDFYSQLNVPMIFLTGSNSSGYRAYSLYGTALYAQGNSTFMKDCYASLLLK